LIKKNTRSFYREAFCEPNPHIHDSSTSVFSIAENQTSIGRSKSPPNRRSKLSRLQLTEKNSTAQGVSMDGTQERKNLRNKKMKNRK
jgi:hypothetical protein